jgi:DNA polymerase elongation subunit (family B)
MKHEHNILFFDIETTANFDAIQYMPEPSAPGNYKDAEKIAAYIAEKKAEQMQSAALDADYGRIIAIGTHAYPHGEAVTHLAGDPETPDEKSLIQWFWGLFEACLQLSCGYNIIGFDLPYLMRRSMELGIEVIHKPDLRKYSEYPTIDLMGILYGWGPAKGLKFVCKRYGIANPLPELNGSLVDGMEPETLRAYCANDVELTLGLYKKMAGVYLSNGWADSAE